MIVQVLVICTAMLLAACASKPVPAPAAEPLAAVNEPEPLGDGKQICGWGDTGRWECHKSASKKRRTKNKNPR